MPTALKTPLDDTLDRLSEDELAKERLRVILACERDEMTAVAACAELGIGRSRFYQLRRDVLQAALDSLAPGRPGRPRVAGEDDAPEVHDLRHRVHDLSVQLEIQSLRLALLESDVDIHEQPLAPVEKGDPRSHLKARKARQKAEDFTENQRLPADN